MPVSLAELVDRYDPDAPRALARTLPAVGTPISEWQRK